MYAHTAAVKHVGRPAWFTAVTVVAPAAVPCSETYQYYTLPFCQHKDGKKYVTEDLGEVLEGDRLVNTPYDIKFREDVENQVLCTKKLTGDDLYNIRMAIAEDYYFQVRSRLRSSMISHSYDAAAGMVSKGCSPSPSHRQQHRQQEICQGSTSAAAR
jgi:hypothetical protein